MTFTGLPMGDLLSLFGLFGGALVVLYLLKLRRRQVEVPFGPLWARVTSERQASALFRALKRVLSLLLQLAILALVVLALGNPTLGDGSAAAGCGYEPPRPPPERHTLILMDASASMAALEGGLTRLERAREAAHRVIDQLGDNPNHRAMVVQVDARVRPLALWTADRKRLHAAVDAVAAPADTPTQVEDALRLAETAIAGRAEAEVVFVTDRAFAPIAAERAQALALKVVPVGEAPSAERVNVGLQSFNVRPYLDDSLTYAIFFAVKNESDRPLKANLFLYANDEGRGPEDFLDDRRLVGTHALELPAGGVLEDVIGDVKFAGSRLAARVELASDEAAHDVFARDDVAFALVPERRVLKVQLVTEGNLFLHASLFVRENVDFTVVAPEDYRGPEGFDVTVVDGVSVDMARPGAYFVLDPRPDGPFDVSGRLEAPEIGRVDAKHPIARHLKLVDLAIAEAAKVRRERGDQVVAAAKDGSPLVLTRVDAGGRRAFAMVAFDVRKSLLPLNYAFPLLVVNVLNWFYQEQDGLLKPNRAGVELAVPFPHAGTRLALLGPGGEAAGAARKVADRAHFSVERIGVWELRGEAAEARVPVAVNLMSPEESRIAPRGEYPAWTPPPSWSRPVNPWLEHLWRVLLLAALALVTLEWVTWNRRVTV